MAPRSRPSGPRGGRNNTAVSNIIVARDWLGRRVDLRECHRDPSCATHRDALAPCSCRALFLQWDFVVDWIMCALLVSTVVLCALALDVTFS